MEANVLLERSENAEAKISEPVHEQQLTVSLHVESMSTQELATSSPASSEQDTVGQR